MRNFFRPPAALDLAHRVSRLSVLLVMVLPLSFVGCGDPRSRPATGLNHDAGADAGEWCRRRLRGECLERVLPADTLLRTFGIDETHLYFTSWFNTDESNVIRRVSKETSEVEVVTSLPYTREGSNYVTQILVDRGLLYYATAPRGSDASALIARVPVTGGSPELLVEGLATNAQLAMNGEWLYYADIDEIRRLDVHGGSSEPFIETGVRTWWLDAQDDEIYWMHLGNSATDFILSRAATDFSRSELLIRSSTLSGMRLGRTHMYLSSRTGELTRQPLNGGEPEHLATVGVEEGPGRGVVVSTHHFYIVVGSNLLRVPVEGGAVEEVLPVESSTFTMIADVDAVYAFILNEGVYRIPDAP